MKLSDLDGADMIGMTIKLRDGDGRFGTVVDETNHKVQINWGTGALTWENKRDLVTLD